MANQLQDIRDFADNHNLDNVYLALENAIALNMGLYVYANPIDENGFEDATEEQARAALREDPGLLAVYQRQREQ